MPRNKQLIRLTAEKDFPNLAEKLGKEALEELLDLIEALSEADAANVLNDLEHAANLQGR